MQQLRVVLGDVPAEAGSPPVRTRYPSGPNQGQLADRYAAYADIPLLLKPLAEQLGSAGYWYVPPANPLDTLTDEGSQASDAFVTGLDKVTSGITGDAKKALLIGGGVLLAVTIVPAFLRRR